MYYIVYPLLYLLSLLPLVVLYLISDFFYILLYYISGYRKKVVLNNLRIAFPEKTEQERIRIAKDFYHHFTDTFIETIKLLSISRKAFDKRVSINFEPVLQMAARGKSIQLYGAHQMNWEFVNWTIAPKLPIPWVGIYMAISNKALDRIFIDLRSKYKTVLVPAQQFKSMMHDIFKEQYCVGLAADQNPGSPSSGYWLNFMGRPAPFVWGPSKAAVKQGLAAFYVEFIRTKRGYYNFNVLPMFENGSSMTQEEIVRLYRSKVEDCVRKNPANYLWSHRRWKFDYDESLSNLWIDTVPPAKTN